MIDPDLRAALVATWPPRETVVAGGFRIGRTEGAGWRVNAAVAEGSALDPDAATAAMATPIFQVDGTEADLDRALAGRNLRRRRDTVVYIAPAAELAADTPVRTIYPGWPPLAVQDEIWAAGGIDAPRRAVMAAVPEPKTALLARNDARAAGTAFVAVAGDIAVLHAVEVAEAHRRHGVGGRLLAAAAAWGRDHGAWYLALAVTATNPAGALYAGAGMAVAGRYHYRVRE